MSIQYHNINIKSITQKSWWTDLIIILFIVVAALSGYSLGLKQETINNQYICATEKSPSINN